MPLTIDWVQHTICVMSESLLQINVTPILKPSFWSLMTSRKFPK